jgi:putative aldouronate transport system substrate-binding protein
MSKEEFMVRPGKSRFLFLIALSACLLTLVCAGAAATGKQEVPKLVFYFPGTAPRDLQVVIDEINRRAEGSVGAQVEFRFVPWSDYPTKINTLIASGDNYDAHFDGDWLNFYPLSSKGALLPLDDLLPKNAPTLWKGISKEKWDATRVNGKILAVPWKWDKTERMLMVIREDLRKKYGVAAPTGTLESAEPFLEAIKKNNPEMTPLGLDTGVLFAQSPPALFYAAGYFPLLWGQGILYKVDETKPTLVAEESTDWYKSAVQLARQWQLKGYISSEVLAQKETEADQITQGLAGAGITNTQGAVTFNQQVKDSHPDWQFVGYPLYPDKPAHLTKPTDNIIVFNSKAAHPDLALKFLDWAHQSQQNYDLVIYGIEGKDYVMGTDGIVRLPSGVSSADSPYMGWNGEWGLWWFEFARRQEGDPVGWKAALPPKSEFPLDKLGPLGGFVPDLEPVKTEMAQRVALQNDIGNQLKVGLVDPDVALADYVQKQEAAGTSKILATLQGQLEAWLSQQK